MKESELVSCANCVQLEGLDIDFTMAFQPIVHLQSKCIFGYEALARGLNNEPAYSVLSQVNDKNRYAFDQMCRVKAIELAAKLDLSSYLSINFLPNAIYQPQRCIRTTLAAAEKYGFPVERIMFEFTEVEKISDSGHIKRVVEYYRTLGFKTATDDFGSGYSGLNLLADFQTDIIKFDMGLIRDIHIDKVRQVILRHCISLCHKLQITTLAEGVETSGEFEWLQSEGVDLIQGYFIAKPGFECLPSVDFSQL
ncbi:EAL domain-containing protein [Pseudoalteromonas citrea]|uniref:EAL domain-containing protein n=1 Tax=Pseudoalteromonas citrea TaxID=43655 RepID=A0A5S3XMJ6_9GAMM|nr:EAL domain-containing protein [Pseudoalteromonas citrea]TMP38314.1 EAL domain-containing protein [Pseudoalteromonas citrea]TMP54758.1 EAL domain-containing protein [Pseudoalteromonas citrea]